MVYSPLKGKTYPVSKLPREIVISVRQGAKAYTGRAKAMKIGGVEVIVIGRTMADLKTVYDHVQSALHGGPANMPEQFVAMLSPEVAMVAKEAFTFDDEL